MDIKYQENGDIDISTGDIRYVEGVEQHKLTILLTQQGLLKSRPDVGVDVANYLLDNEPGELLREARKHCQRIGMKIKAIYFKNQKIIIEGGYENN